MEIETRDIQVKVCNDMKAEICDVFAGDKVGISQTALDGVLPINGMRCFMENGSTCWFIWGGEDFSENVDFFMPLHVGHLATKCPLSIKFLLLPLGWRFLTDGSHEDIWFDASIATN